MSIEFLETDLEKVSYLCNLLISKATGSEPSDEEYQTLRYELLRNGSISKFLPSWLKVNRDLSSFWNFIQPKFSKYAERRSFLSEEFSTLLNYLEFGEEANIPNIPKMLQENSRNTRNFSVSHSTDDMKKNKKKVFIVHGRDNETKQEIARFVETIGLEAIILHEQASSGMTIIEKIEYYSSEADFALILYTPCDEGRGIHERKHQPKKRARQNVVFEHGYLMSELGRRNVCALVKGDIETPTDISGVVYVGLDDAGAWKTEVVKELTACGYTVKNPF